MPQLGNLSLNLLIDAYDTIGGDNLFSPAVGAEWQQALGFADTSDLNVCMTALLIDDGAELTLVDTGFGSNERAERDTSLVKSMAAQGIAPESINRVIITHAHGDHCMGNTIKRGARWLPVFANAEYVMQRSEYAAGEAVQDPVWLTRIAPLTDTDQLRLIEGRVAIDEHLTCWPTPGHTIGHQCVLIESEGQKALHLGDLAVLRQSLLRPEWGPDWAWSHEEDTLSRRRVIVWALEESAVLIAGHDGEMPWIRLALDGDALVPMPAQF